MPSITSFSSSDTRKPTYPNEYRDWLRSVHKCEMTDAIENHYKVVSRMARDHFVECQLWKSITSQLRSLDDQYLILKKANLIHEFDPQIVVKPFESFLEKTYRKNILLNANYPAAPERGWLLPPDWFSKINDVIRTTVTVKYLDGVDFIQQEVLRLARAKAENVHCAYEARIEGYYALHLYYSSDVVIPKTDFTNEQRKFQFEMQITTQIKEIIKEILHSFYEKARQAHRVGDGRDWRWNYESDEFVANNLGHILHYIEGMIVQVRDRQRRS